MIRVEHEQLSGKNPVTGVEQHGEIVAIAIDRPDKRNALTVEMMANLGDAIDRAANNPKVRVVLLRGEGSAFCAGFDLDACRDDPLVMRSLLTGLSNVIVAMRKCPCPVVIAAHGAAIAGGCALLGGGDFVITNAHAKFGYPVTRLGISPAVSSPFLRQMVGDGPARARLLDSELIDGTAACAIGLAHECLDNADAVVPRAMDLARAIASKPAGSLRETKRWLNHLDGSCDGETIHGALHASLGLVGGDEERMFLNEMWERTK